MKQRLEINVVSIIHKYYLSLKYCLYCILQLDPIKHLTFVSNVAKSIDLKTISKKTYESFDELRNDFAWFIRNCLSINRNERDVVKAANSAWQILNDQIQELNLCVQCYKHSYENPNESITMVCDPPHRLLWVDSGRYGYWPAKMLRSEADDQLTVRYFGDQTTSKVSSDLCLMYSEAIPENAHGSGSGTELFDEAVKVMC